MAIWEINRSARYFNIAAGIWLAATPLVLDFNTAIAGWNNILTGALITVFSLSKGSIKQQYGGGWRSLFRKS